MEPSFRPGTTVLGKYRIEGALGRHGMYVAVRVSHPRERDLVLEMLLPESAISLAVHARCVCEAQAAQRLRGEHVARLIDVGISSDGVPYLVTEALRGVDLGAELARRGALIAAEAVDYVLQICDALAEAHAHGIVHRRVRPASVLLTARPDGSLLVKLLEFGIAEPPPAASAPASASAIDPVARPVPGPAGSTAYLAPEQIRWPDEVDGRADIWSVGALLYECLTGQRVAASPGRPMDPQIPPGLQAVVLRCLETDRDARFPSIAALATALAPYAHDHRMAGFVVEHAHRLAQGVHDPADPIGEAVSRGVGIPTALPAGRGARPPVGSISELRAERGTALLMPEVAAGGSRRWTRRRTATIAAVALGVTIGGIATAALIGPGRSHGGGPAVAARPVAASAGAPGSAVAIAAPPPGPAPGTNDRDARLAACVELQRARRWNDLDGCARELAELGATGKAEQLRATAHQELQNEQLDGQARRALDTGDLAQARAALQQIEAGSVYAAGLRDAFTAAEQQRTDEARRRAQQLAATHDRAARPASSPGADHASRPRKASCDSIDVGDLMTRAAIDYDGGSPAAALSLTRVALGCKQTDRMYWLAVMYACAAHDAASARQYYSRVPANLQPGIERKCQQDNLDVRTR